MRNRQKFIPLLKGFKMSKVNLDALIPREDFDYLPPIPQVQLEIRALNVSQLLPPDKSQTSVYTLIKKPDFQRETNGWDKQKIADFIECYYDGSFIPSIILWKNQKTGNIFVIDGAHRLSALIAYFNDDYGDGKISLDFYGGYKKLSQAELDLAGETREYVNKRIGGSYQAVIGNSKHKLIADGINLRELEVQRINGDIKKAEDSFFKINQYQK